MTEIIARPESVAVRVQDALKRYGSNKQAALDNVTMEIEAGELLAILGPSGSGKTTLLNVLAGLESVASGHVLFGDEDVTELAPEQRGIGVVFQSSMLYPHLTLLESIGFAPKLAKVPKDEVNRRIMEVTSWLNIQHLLKRRPSEVSGGERQRAAIAKALVTRPRLLLMDEPFSAVDAQLRRQLRTELVKLHRTIGTTTVFVTHDQEEAMSIADRVAVMSNGKLVQIGTPMELYRTPVSSWLADFVSTQPLNLFDAHVDAAGRIVLLANSLTIEGSAGHPEGTKLTVGVRPEHVALRPVVGDGGRSGVTWRVLTQEMLGSVVKYVVSDGRGNEVTALTTADDVIVPDMTVSLSIQLDRCMLFDATTQLAMRTPVAGGTYVS
ncbi:MAG: carbohydrate transporter ATP-binding protein family [Aeromicrobium sp.]|jgi:multiple sugar transport system ATP-binding protein|nr:carbohydrate transporter ATP-binding protein family [Aeromicrobium sp.]